WPRLRDCSHLGLSVLAQDQGAACRSLSMKQGDRFASVPWVSRGDGAVFVHGATVWLHCTLRNEFAAGDHVIALMQIHGLRADPDAAPLVFHGSKFRQLVVL
ncbi:MAG: flavin reductase family protein, partial [Rhodococcus sp. (in: high G+C Gram-positive bacteria)]|uniref:flavin reductase family protein n=1 Tax=Rhodococcus sp. TaxID=1831 RepID=UPI003BB02A3F